MRLVNGKRRDVPLLQVIEEAGEQQALGRDVEQFAFTLVQPAQARAGFA